MSRVHSDRIYVSAIPQGLSGFRRPSIMGLVTGHRFRKEGKQSATRRGITMDAQTYRLEDGRLPEFQERANLTRATEWLLANPWSAAVVDPPVPAH